MLREVGRPPPRKRVHSDGYRRAGEPAQVFASAFRATSHPATPPRSAVTSSRGTSRRGRSSASWRRADWDGPGGALVCRWAHRAWRSRVWTRTPTTSCCSGRANAAHSRPTAGPSQPDPFRERDVREPATCAPLSVRATNPGPTADEPSPAPEGTFAMPSASAGPMPASGRSLTMAATRDIEDTHCPVVGQHQRIRSSASAWCLVGPLSKMARWWAMRLRQRRTLSMSP